MHASELLQLYILKQNSFNQATLIEAKLVTATNNGSKPSVETIPYVPLLLAPICFMIVWAVILVIVSSVRKLARDKDERDKDEIVTIQRFQQIPCSNCRFNNNHYLKCALHPSTALTKQALNYSDYSVQ